eukprot:jgi/Ulvmu1/9843/UM056_0085.1
MLRKANLHATVSQPGYRQRAPRPHPSFNGVYGQGSCRDQLHPVRQACGPPQRGSATPSNASHSQHHHAELRFSDSQLESFAHLHGGMRGYAKMAVAASAVAVAKAAHVMITTQSLHVPPARASYLAVHLITAGIVWKAAALLPQPGAPPALHEPLLMHSMRAMSVVFLQMGTMHWFVSAVTMMDAAITWPFLIRVFSAVVVAVCLVRVYALGYMLEKYSPTQQAELHIESVLGRPLRARVPWLDRVASLLVGGGLSLAATELQTHRRGSSLQSEEGEVEYEFNAVEHKTLSALMDSIRGASAATTLMCLSHCMAFAAKICSPTAASGAWVASMSACAEAGVVAGIMLYSANCFGSIIASRGRDVQLLMQGIASDRGLLKLFGRLEKVQKAAILGAVIPVVVKLSDQVAGKVI